jgi:hypothetical protein
VKNIIDSHIGHYFRKAANVISPRFFDEHSSFSRLIGRFRGTQGIGYEAIPIQKISHWLPARVIDRLPNGSLVTLGSMYESLNREIPDGDRVRLYFILAVLNRPPQMRKMATG